MVCHLCGADKPLIRAHIIAQCLLEPLMVPNAPLIKISQDASKHLKAYQTG